MVDQPTFRDGGWRTCWGKHDKMMYLVIKQGTGKTSWETIWIVLIGVLALIFYIQDVPPSYHQMSLDFLLCSRFSFSLAPSLLIHLPSFPTCTCSTNHTHLAAILLPHPNINAGHVFMCSANLFVGQYSHCVQAIPASLFGFACFLDCCLDFFGTSAWMFKPCCLLV